MYETIDARWVKRDLFKHQKSGLYYGNVRDKRSGRVYRFSTGTKNRKHANDRVNEWISEAKLREAHQPAPGRRFEPTFREWLAEKKTNKPLREVTFDAYVLDLEGLYLPV